MEKIITISTPIYQTPKATDYLQFQTLNIVNEWQQYKHHCPYYMGMDLMEYITDKYGWTEEQALNEYSTLRDKIQNENKTRIAV